MAVSTALTVHLLGAKIAPVTSTTTIAKRSEKTGAKQQYQSHQVHWWQASIVLLVVHPPDTSTQMGKIRV